jgi:hypothetical protein
MDKGEAMSETKIDVNDVLVRLDQLKRHYTVDDAITCIRQLQAEVERLTAQVRADAQTMPCGHAARWQAVRDSIQAERPCQKCAAIDAAVDATIKAVGMRQAEPAASVEPTKNWPCDHCGKPSTHSIHGDGCDWWFCDDCRPTEDAAEERAVDALLVAAMRGVEPEQVAEAMDKRQPKPTCERCGLSVASLCPQCDAAEAFDSALAEGPPAAEDSLEYACVADEDIPRPKLAGQPEPEKWDVVRNEHESERRAGTMACDEPKCPACQKPWRIHPGCVAMCKQLAARDAEIARCHEAICCLTGEVERLRGVIRNLRAERRDVELCNRHLLAGFAWTAETEAFVRQEWDRETERICNGGAE